MEWVGRGWSWGLKYPEKAAGSLRNAGWLLTLPSASRERVALAEFLTSWALSVSDVFYAQNNSSFLWLRKLQSREVASPLPASNGKSQEMNLGLVSPKQKPFSAPCIFLPSWLPGLWEMQRRKVVTASLSGLACLRRVPNRPLLAVETSRLWGVHAGFLRVHIVKSEHARVSSGRNAGTTSPLTQWDALMLVLTQHVTADFLEEGLCPLGLGLPECLSWVLGNWHLTGAKRWGFDAKNLQGVFKPCFLFLFFCSWNEDRTKSWSSPVHKLFVKLFYVWITLSVQYVRMFVICVFLKKT